MNHLGDIAQVITALGLLLTGGSSALNLFFTWRNGERAKKITALVGDIKEQTDGINEKLVKVTGEAEHAEGLKHGEKYAERNGQV